MNIVEVMSEVIIFELENQTLAQLSRKIWMNVTGAFIITGFTRFDEI